MEEAKLAIDLVGLEYPADIEATYNDLPTNYDKLILLREHLYYLYTIGTETNNDDLADYALFANLHVRYRILQFQTTLTASDEYYHRIYEQKLPRMKWHPLTLHHHEIKTITDECVCELVTPDVNEVKVSIVQEPRYTVSHTYDPVVPVYMSVTERTPFVNDCVENINESETPAVYDPTVRSVIYHRHCIILRSYERSRLFSVRLCTSSCANVVGLSGYGVWFYDSIELYARLFRHMTGRFSYYEDAAVFLKATGRRKGCHSLTTLALQYLSKTWFTSPPSW